MRCSDNVGRRRIAVIAAVGLLGLPASVLAQEPGAPPPINQADTAWMLVATALVLLMTPALAFFYGGLVRSKNALNTMMMSVVALGFVGVIWALAGYSLAFAPGQRLDRRLVALSASAASRSTRRAPSRMSCSWRSRGRSPSSPRRSSPAPSSSGCGSPPTSCSSRCGRSPSTARSPTGSGAAAGWPSWAPSTSPAARSCTSTPGAAALVAALVVGKRQQYPSSSLLAPQRAVHAARRRPALVRLVRVQRRQRGGGQRDRRARVRDHDAGAGRDAGGLDVPRRDAGRASRRPSARRPPSSSASSRSRPAAGFISPMSAIALGAIAAVPSYLVLIWRAKSSLDDSLDVVAAHGVGGTVGALLTGVFAAEEPQWCRRRPALRQPGPARDSGRRRARGDGLQRRDDLRAAEARQPRAAAARDGRRREHRASISACTARKPTCTRVRAGRARVAQSTLAVPRPESRC